MIDIHKSTDVYSISFGCLKIRILSGVQSAKTIQCASSRARSKGKPSACELKPVRPTNMSLTKVANDPLNPEN